MQLFSHGFGFAAAFNAKFLQDMADVGLDRRQANPKNGADFSVALIGADQPQHLQFGVRQRRRHVKVRFQKIRISRRLIAGVVDQHIQKGRLFFPAARFQKWQHRHAVNADGAHKAVFVGLIQSRTQRLLPGVVAQAVLRNGRQHVEMNAVDVTAADAAVVLQRRQGQQRLGLRRGKAPPWPA